MEAWKEAIKEGIFRNLEQKAQAAKEKACKDAKNPDRLNHGVGDGSPTLPPDRLNHGVATGDVGPNE